MLKFCPILSGDGHMRECWHEGCEFANIKGNCLIVEALRNYNNKCYQERKQVMKDYYEAKGEWQNLPF